MPISTLSSIDSVLFVALAGDPPEELGLGRLPDFQKTFDCVSHALRPFLSEGAQLTLVTNLDSIVADDGRLGLQIIYIVGHAWLVGTDLKVAVRDGTTSRQCSGTALLERLSRGHRAGQTIAIFDSCHASAFARSIETLAWKPRLAVFASAEDESAIAFPVDGATRLALALSTSLGESAVPVDLVRVLSNVIDELHGDGIVQGQTVDYQMNGPRITLSRGPSGTRPPRGRTVRLIRNALVVAGAAAAVLVLGAAWFYRTHVLLEVAVGDLSAIADRVELVVTVENPAENTSIVIGRHPLNGRKARFWLPATDVIVRVNARYKDASPRDIAFHLVLAPTFLPSHKLVGLSSPTAAEVAGRARMALVSATEWHQGRDLDRTINTRSFWIDIAPPTVTEYLPFIEAHLRSANISLDDTVIPRAIRTKLALTSVGLEQLKPLSRNLGDIFATISQATGAKTARGGDIADAMLDVACPDCPAPMTREEAELFCSARNGRLPTSLEWELAARGVDGRVYPWGDRFDPSRANVVGLPNKGHVPFRLKPSAMYSASPSPFGVVDMVGNAGDWVVNANGSYEAVFMGGTYRFNPEDATSFLMTPAVEGLTRNEITTRCVFDRPLSSSPQ